MLQLSGFYCAARRAPAQDCTLGVWILFWAEDHLHVRGRYALSDYGVSSKAPASISFISAVHLHSRNLRSSMADARGILTEI